MKILSEEGGPTLHCYPERSEGSKDYPQECCQSAANPLTYVILSEVKDLDPRRPCKKYRPTQEDHKERGSWRARFFAALSGASGKMRYYP